MVINPGNPTGQALSYEVMKDIIKFCEERSLVIIADEVYQNNVYDPSKEFHSFRKVILELNSPVELLSIHSLSKGFYGECGLRGGYLHLHNID